MRPGYPTRRHLVREFDSVNLAWSYAVEIRSVLAGQWFDLEGERRGAAQIVGKFSKMNHSDWVYKTVRSGDLVVLLVVSMRPVCTTAFLHVRDGLCQERQSGNQRLLE